MNTYILSSDEDIKSIQEFDHALSGPLTSESFEVSTDLQKRLSLSSQLLGNKNLAYRILLGDSKLHNLSLAEIMEAGVGRRLSKEHVYTILGNKDNYEFLKLNSSSIGLNFLDTGIHMLGAERIAVVGGIYSKKHFTEKSWNLELKDRIYFTHDQIEKIIDNAGIFTTRINKLITHQAASAVLPKPFRAHGSAVLNNLLVSVAPDVYIYGHHKINAQRRIKQESQIMLSKDIKSNFQRFLKNCLVVGVGKFNKSNYVLLNDDSRTLHYPHSEVSSNYPRSRT
jgi:Icc-related predicted phosphoesterase